MNMMKKIDSVDLICVDAATNSNKEYHLQLVETTPGIYDVNAQWGRRGGTLQQGAKATGVSLEKALKLFTKVKNEKLSASPAYIQETVTKSLAYEDSIILPVTHTVIPKTTPAGVVVSPAQTETPILEGNLKRKIRVQWAEKEEHYVPQLLNPIDENEVEKYLKDDAWGAQEKKDGVHVMVKVVNEPSNHIMKVFNKKGKEIPFIKEWLNDFSHACLLDGEKIGDYYHVFDILDLYTNSLRLSGYEERHEILSKLKFLSKFKIVPLAIGYKAKKELYERLLKEDKEGIVFKRLNAIHTPGRPASGGDMLKFKFYSTASVRVAPGREGKRSIGMEVLDGNVWTFVGNCTIPPNKEIPEIGCVVEVRMLYYNKGGSIYQPTYLGFRDDTEPEECVISQLKCKPKPE